jgi:Rieske Fe-S protein
LIVRRSAGVYLALSMRCTHKGCDVEPPKDAVLVCPCHNSRFDLAGAVVKGPATIPLARYPLTYNSETGQVAVKFS